MAKSLFFGDTEKLKQTIKENPKAVQAAAGIAHSLWLTPIYNAIRVAYLAHQKGIPCPPLTQGMGATAAQMTTRLGLRLGGFPFVTEYINQRYKEGNPFIINGTTLSKEQAIMYGSWAYFVAADSANLPERAAIHTSNRMPKDPTFSQAFKTMYQNQGLPGATKFMTNGVLSTMTSRQGCYWAAVIPATDAIKKAVKEQGYSDTAANTAGIVGGAIAGTATNAFQTPTSLIQRECQGPDRLPPLTAKQAYEVVSTKIKSSANPIRTAYTGVVGRALVTAVSGVATLAGAETQRSIMDWAKQQPAEGMRK